MRYLIITLLALSTIVLAVPAVGLKVSKVLELTPI
jgi:hypothetical protein